MAKYGLDTNIIVTATKIIAKDVAEGRLRKEDITTGKDNIIYKILRDSVKGLRGELVTTRSVVEELRRNLDPSSKHYHRLKSELSSYFPLIMDFIKNKVRIFSLSDEEYHNIKEMRPKLSKFPAPEWYRKKRHKDIINIYTDYLFAKECSVNDITNVVTRNVYDFDIIREFDPSIKIPRLVTPNQNFYDRADEEFTLHFTSSIAGRLLEAIYRDRYLLGSITD